MDQVNKDICSCCGGVLDTARVTYYQDGKVIRELHKSCSVSEKMKDFDETRILTTSLYLEASLIADSLDKKIVVYSMQELELLEKEWELEVWFGGYYPQSTLDRHGYATLVKPNKNSLQDFVLNTNTRCFSAKVDDLEYISFTVAGRSLFQIQNEQGFSITLIVADNDCEIRGGIQGIYCTLAWGKKAINQCIHDWKQNRIVWEEAPNYRII